jgi:hypothetical protein
MAHATPQTNSKSTLTPQATGFSQIHTRGGGEGGGQAMSVLLSWHEKVRFLFCFDIYLSILWHGVVLFFSSVYSSCPTLNVCPFSLSCTS